MLPLIAAFVTAVVCFVLSALYSQARIAAIDHDAAEIALNSAPSVQRLARLRATIPDLVLATEDLVSAGALDGSAERDRVSALEREMSAHARAYLDLPHSEEERALWRAIGRDLFALRTAAIQAREQARAGRFDAADRTIHGELAEAAAAAVRSVDANLDFDAQQAERLAGQIREVRLRGARMAFGLTGASAGLTVLAAYLAIAAVRHALQLAERERSRADARADELAEAARFAALGADIGAALAAPAPRASPRPRCAPARVAPAAAAFARIWILDEAGGILRLCASAGLYTHLEGPHAKVPVGQSKVGAIARDRQPLLTNEVVGDPVIDQEWARREGLVSFAGHPLLVEERLVGVMALFARHPLAESTQAALGAAAHEVALGIARGWAEEERNRLLARERRARCDAERLNRIKDEFLATVSHELRTPLTPILGWAHMLAQHVVPAARIDEALAIIGRNATAQARLVDELLDVARITSGKLSLHVRQLDIAELVTAAVDTVRPAADAKDIAIETRIDPAVGRLAGDEDRLRQVLWNLLSNAVKFTQRGGHVETTAERREGQVVLTVRDDGPGIPAEFIPRVFDRFEQADASATRAYGGLGLGLAIARHLVELHGGTIAVESGGAGRGSIFTVRLPIRATAPIETAPATPPRARAGVAVTEASLRGLRVLAVDDDPDARGLLSVMLQRYGAEPVLAASANEAMRLLRATKPDVLVSDIGMPEEDGYALVARIRALGPADPLAHLPAIALTAYARPEERTRALEAGFDRHVAKPVESEELAAAIAEAAGRAASPPT